MQYDVTGCVKCDSTKYKETDVKKYVCSNCNEVFIKPKIVKTLKVFKYIDLIRLLVDEDDYNTTKLFGPDYPLDRESNLVNFRELPIYSLEGDVYKKLVLDTTTLRYTTHAITVNKD